MRASLPGWPVERIQTLYNRVDVDALKARQVPAGEARQALGLDPRAWIVGNVGRLHPDKDQATLLKGFAQALPRLPSGARLAILGEGRLKGKLVAQAEALGVAAQVDFLGQVPDARHYFRAFDAFALSSDHEPFGMVLLEAMVAGVPLLATACGGATEVVEGVGLMFPLGDAGHLAQGLEHLAGLGPAQRAECAERMLDRLRERFSDDAVRETFWRLPQVVALTADA
jgi:glycosyltransferase involved in cell wall biosynthesis